MARDYYLRLVCPRCFHSKWRFQPNSTMTLQEVENSYWVFACPVHGWLREKPLEASVKRRIVPDEEG